MIRTIHPTTALAWGGSPSLTILTALMLATTLVTGVGVFADPMIVTGVPAWLKPFKFSVSVATYSLTMAWLIGLFARDSRPALRLGDALTAGLVAEMIVIVMQAARGTLSHYNQATPFDAAMYSVMAAGIIVITASHLGLLVLAWRAEFDDPNQGTMVRAALLVTLVGMILGGLMNQPTPDQLAQLQAGVSLDALGAHTLGAPDGGPGLPLVNWSTIAGDRRVAHFFGLHALQLVPLLAWLMGRRLGGRRHRDMIRLTAGAYLGALLVFTQQAQRAESVVNPSWLTITLAGVLITLTSLIALRILTRDAAP